MIVFHFCSVRDLIRNSSHRARCFGSTSALVKGPAVAVEPEARGRRIARTRRRR
jgi:hypothetical protein